MNGAAALLNDIGLTNFSYAAQLPYLRRANEYLENLLIANGIAVQLQESTTVSVLASASNIDLATMIGYPSDMLLPIRLWERSNSSQNFVLMGEHELEPSYTPVNYLSIWEFRNNTIYVPGINVATQVKIDYWRQLATVTSSSSNEEVAGSKALLEARTAEQCARYAGQNSEIADSLLNNEVIPAQDLLERIYIKNSQGSRSRRKPFRRR